MMLDSTLVCRRALGCEWEGIPPFYPGVQGRTLLPLVAAVHPAKQRVEPAARRLPDRARRGAGVLTNLILGVELLRLAQRRLGSRGDLLAHRVLLLEGSSSK